MHTSNPSTFDWVFAAEEEEEDVGWTVASGAFLRSEGVLATVSC